MGDGGWGDGGELCKILFFIDEKIIVLIFLYLNNLISILVKKEGRELLVWR